MKLVLIHGINQQKLSSEHIEAEWLETLRSGNGLSEAWPKNVATIVTPFYGDALHTLSMGSDPNNPLTIAQGIDDGSDDFSAFARPILEEMALAIGVSKEEILAQSEGQTIEQGYPHKSWLKAIARAIEAISPIKGRLAFMLVKQAHAYVTFPHVAEAVDDLVRPALEDDGPMVIVAHSLGSVVAFKLLREFQKYSRPRNVPLFITLGSPLGIDAIRRHFPQPRVRPQAVRRWINGSDRNDFVALRSELNAVNFGAGPIDNLTDIDNGEDSHNAAGRGYLRDTRIGREIAAALR